MRWGGASRILVLYSEAASPRSLFACANRELKLPPNVRRVRSRRRAIACVRSVVRRGSEASLVVAMRQQRASDFRHPGCARGWRPGLSGPCPNHCPSNVPTMSHAMSLVTHASRCLPCHRDSPELVSFNGSNRPQRDVIRGRDNMLRLALKLGIWATATLAFAAGLAQAQDKIEMKI